jgi:hypothetical protein
LIAAKSLDSDGRGQITNGQDVLAVARRTLKDEGRIKDVRNLLVLMDLVWQLNFRAGMRSGGVAMGLCVPRWQQVLSYIDLDIVPPPDGADWKDELEVLDAVEVEFTIELPTLRALRKTTGDVIRNVWRDGGSYRKALQDWRRRPSQENKRFLANELGQYSRIIIQAVKAGTAVQKIDVASIAANLLIPALGLGLGASAVYAHQHREGLSDETKIVWPMVMQASPVLFFIPSALGWRRKTEARIRREEIAVGSGNREIVLT